MDDPDTLLLQIGDYLIIVNDRPIGVNMVMDRFSVYCLDSSFDSKTKA